MQITGKNLLTQAESLIRDRRDRPVRSVPGEARKLPAMEAGASQARLIHLQGRLSDTQNEFSREQTRMSYLESGSIPEGLLFDGTPLFPEKDTGGLREKVQERLTGLERSLRALQVEMENMAALGLVSMDFDPAELGRAMGPVDPVRVSRLTR